MVNIIVALLSNLIALLVVKNYLAGVSVTDNLVGLGIVVLLMAVANSFLLPMLRYMFKPFIWLTAGILALVLNGVVIYLVDYLTPYITIGWFLPLLYTAIVFGFINGLFALGAKAFK